MRIVNKGQGWRSEDSELLQVNFAVKSVVRIDKLSAVDSLSNLQSFRLCPVLLGSHSMTTYVCISLCVQTASSFDPI